MHLAIECESHLTAFDATSTPGMSAQWSASFNHSKVATGFEFAGEVVPAPIFFLEDHLTRVPNATGRPANTDLGVARERAQAVDDARAATPICCRRATLRVNLGRRWRSDMTGTAMTTARERWRGVAAR